MNNKKHLKYFYIFIGLYFILNIVNTYFLTTHTLNRYISPLKRTLVGEVTAFFGNFSILLIFLLIVVSIVKKNKNQMRVLLGITVFLNIFILISGFFTYFYSTVFNVQTFELLQNPTEGIGKGILTLVLTELVSYYRIAVFIPTITLLVFLIIYKRKTKDIEFVEQFSFNFKTRLSMFLSFVVMLTIVNISYIQQLKDENYFNIKALSSTNAVQNFGVYPYYINEFLGIDLDVTTKKSLNIETEKNLFDEYNEFNKNQDSYINFLDNKIYSNKLLLEDSIVEKHDDLILPDGESLTGIFEGKDLVLVHLESLNYLLWEIPELRERFEFLNLIFEESVVFENYYTSVGMGVSSDAEASVMMGLYMNGYSTLYLNYKDRDYDFDTLPKLFSEKDYKSIPLHNDFKEFYNRDNAYPDLLGFTDRYYNLEDFAIKDGYTDLKEYIKMREKGYEYNGRTITSSWPSEFELHDMMYDVKNSVPGNTFMFPIYLTPHTPFLFNPYNEQEYDIPNYNKLSNITKRYVEYIKYLDEIFEDLFFHNDGTSRIDENTVYIFYSDHGSSLKNGDLSILYNNPDMTFMEERMKLQQTVAWIYAPSSVINDDGINEGLIKGKQELTRGHVDLYRTIGDLFNLFDSDNAYYGVHGLSKEPTFVFDNRIQDVIIDDVEAIGSSNYKPFIVSFRNENNRFKNKIIKNENNVFKKIKHFKKLSDLILSDDTVYKDFKKALQKQS